MVWWWIACGGGGGGRGPACELECPGGTRKVEATTTTLAVEGSFTWSVDETCEVLCEALEPCRAPNVPVVDGATEPPTFACQPVDGFASIPLPSEVDLGFGGAWQEVVPGVESVIQSSVSFETPWRRARGGDDNGDGIDDLYLVSDTEVGVAHAVGDGTFAPGPVAPLPEADSEPVVFADLDGDGLLDLVWVTRTSSTLRWARGRGGLSFAAPQPVGAGPQTTYVDPWITVADVDVDGLDDLVITIRAEGSLRVLFGAPGGPGEPVSVPGTLYGTDCAVGDVDGDGLTDMVNSGGDGTWVRQVAPRVFEPVASGLWSAFLSFPYAPTFDLLDLDGDGRDDLWIQYGYGTTELVTWRSTGVGFEAPTATQDSMDGGLQRLDEADLDGDGRTEWIGFLSFPNTQFLGGERLAALATARPDGTLGLALTGASFSPDAAAAHGDFDGDGRPEAALLAQGFEDTRVVLVTP